MRINPASFINPIVFKKKSIIKQYWLEGKLPTVTHGFYGGLLDKDTLTQEHIQPVSKGGKTILSNLALAKGENNWIRGNKPLKDFFDLEAFCQYCDEFKQVKLPKLNGLEYVKNLIKTVGKELKK